MIPYLTDLFRVQLGETRDPRELVPGDPEAICSVADDLAAQGRHFEEIGDGLGGVRTPGWMGEAADAFWEMFSGEKVNWFKASDAMSEASKSLNGYSHSLSWSQAQAQEAILQWEKGEDLTRQATAQYEAARAAQDQAARAAGAPPIGPPPFSDPGAELREQAQAILKNARQEVSEAGTRAAEAIAARGGKGDDSPSWLAGLADKTAGLIFGDEQGGKSTEGDQGLSPDHADSWWDTGWQGDKWDAGPVDVGMRSRVQALGYETNADANLTEDGFVGEARGEAYFYKVQSEYSAEYLLAETTLETEVSSGVEGGVNASIGKNGVDAGLDAFAGGKVDGTLSSEVAGIGAGVTAEGWVGAGVELGASAEFKDGKWTIDTDVGAALGFGGKIGYEFTVDPGEVVDTAHDAAEAVGDAASAVGNAAETAGSLVDDAAGVLGDGARSAFGTTVSDLW